MEDIYGQRWESVEMRFCPFVFPFAARMRNWSARQSEVLPPEQLESRRLAAVARAAAVHHGRICLSCHRHTKVFAISLMDFLSSCGPLLRRAAG